MTQYSHFSILSPSFAFSILQALLCKLYLVAAILAALFVTALRAADNPLVTVLTTPTPQVDMSWSNHTGTLYVLRRDLDSTDFSDFTAVGSTDTNSFSDTGVVAGRAYEYSISTSDLVNNSVLGFAAAVDAPLEDDRGTVLLVVDNTLSTDLAEELDLVELDLVGDGWTVRRLEWGRHGSGDGPALRAAIQNEVANHPEINTLYFFGKLPMVQSGYANPDGHGSRPHVTDLYYADVDGNWTDNNNYGGSNGPGDGIFDPSSIPSDIELALGRVDTSNMNGQGKGEREQLRDYVHKAHAWRHGRREVPTRSIFGYANGEHKTTVKWAWAVHGGDILGGSTYQSGVDIQADSQTRPGFLGYLYSANSIASMREPTRVLIGANFKSHSHRWWENNHTMRIIIVQPDWGLHAYWGSRPNWHLYHMAAGKPMGFSMRHSVNQNYAPEKYSYLRRNVYMAMMGDPTTRMHPIAPPTQAAATRPDDVEVSWLATNAANLVGYHVYRSATKTGPYTRLTPVPIADTSYSDDSAPAGALYYQIRAVADMTGLPTGSYRNQSQGCFALLKADGTANAIPVASGDSYTVKSDSIIPVALSGSDADGDALTPIVLRHPQHGQLRWEGHRAYYQSFPGYTGSDQFEFILSDGIAFSDSATVTVSVDAQGDTLLAWEFPSGNVDQKSSTWNQAGIAPAELSVGGGLVITNPWPRQDHYAVHNANGGALGANDYISWTITPEDGQQVSLGDLTFGLFAPPGVTLNCALRVSDDGFASHDEVPLAWTGNSGRGTGGNSCIINTADLSTIARAQTAAEPLEFRLYLWHDGASADIVGLGKVTGLDDNFAEDLVITGRRSAVSGDALMIFDQPTLDVHEGEMASFNVRLYEAPSGPLTVTLAHSGGDSDISVVSGGSLTFTPDDWNIWQSVTVEAALDADNTAGSATITADGTGIHPLTITVTEIESLVAHWKLDESIGTTAADNTGNGLNGSLSGGAAWREVGGVIAGALAFDGNDGLLSVANTPLINEEIHGLRSISLWFKADDPTPATQQVLYEEGGASRGLAIYLAGGDVHVFGWNDDADESGWGGTVHSSAVEAGAWHHVALVLDGGSDISAVAFRGWLDGVEIGSGPGSQLWPHTGNIGVGGINNGVLFDDGSSPDSGHHFAGIIDDVRIYNRALDAEDIMRLLSRATRSMALTDWREFHFDDPANAGQGADDHDPMGDGIVNLVKYALGMNPLENGAGHAHLPRPFIDPDPNTSGSYLAIEYIIPAPPAPDANLEVVASTDLLTGHTTEAILVEEDTGEPGIVRYRWRSPYSLDDESIQFMLLEITAP